MSLQEMLRGLARGRNTRWRPRGSNRPRGEGTGLIPLVRSIFRRG